MGYVVGLDLSLTSTGIAALDVGGGALFTHAVRSKGTKADRLPQNTARLRDLAGRITAAVRRVDPDLVVVESALFSSHQDSSAHRRAGLWWLVVDTLDAAYPVVAAAPTTVKKFATGKGNADKSAVLLAVARRWGEDVLPDARGDRADAAVLAALGAYRLGGASLPVTKARTAVCEKVHWTTTHGEIREPQGAAA